MGWEHFCIICDTRRRRKHLFLKTLKTRLYPVLVHLWRLASITRCDVLEQNGERIQKLEMQMEVLVLTASQNQLWMLRYSSLKLMYMQLQQVQMQVYMQQVAFFVANQKREDAVLRNTLWYSVKSTWLNHIRSPRELRRAAFPGCVLISCSWKVKTLKLSLV